MADILNGRINIIDELVNKQKELDRREQSLDQREEEINRLKEELDNKEAKLAADNAKLGERIEKTKKQDEKAAKERNEKLEKTIQEIKWLHDEYDKEQKEKISKAEKKLADIQQEVERLEAAMKQYKDTTSSRITLNVGGVKYFTTKTTLKGKSPYFDVLLSDRWNLQETLDESGELFIDRNGDAFYDILEFFRTGKVVCMENNRERLLEECTFYQIPEMANLLPKPQPARQPKPAPKVKPKAKPKAQVQLARYDYRFGTLTNQY